MDLFYEIHTIKVNLVQFITCKLKMVFGHPLFGDGGGAANAKVAHLGIQIYFTVVGMSN